MTCTPIKERSFRLRRSAGFGFQDGGVSVSLDDEEAGELDLDAPARAVLVDALPLWSDSETGEEALVRCLVARGHAEKDVARLLDVLVQVGLAVRYNIAVPSCLAERTAEWTSQVDEAAKRVATGLVLLDGPEGVVADLVRALAPWGAGVAPVTGDLWKSSPGRWNLSQPLALIILAYEELDGLDAKVRWCAESGTPLLPVQLEASRLAVGPVFLQDVSPCPFCASHGFAAPVSPAAGALPSEGSEGWPGVAQLLADFLAGRPGSEALSAQYVLDSGGALLAERVPLIAPRCSVCSRLNRFPENATIHV